MAGVDAINDELRAQLPIDEIAVCPHDDADRCECRKPKPGLLLRAAEREAIDLAQSFMVGDRYRDIEAGHSAGCRTILIGDGYGEIFKAQPDATVSTLTRATPAAARTEPAPRREWRPPSYWPFVVPALIVVLAVIIFPWLFTIWMSLNEWKVGSPTTFVGLANYLRLPNDPRFIEAVEHTLVYTALSVLLPLVFGTFAAVVFHAKFPWRGFLRAIFIMPMMATPVAIALVWTMMFHPQLGVLNYLLSLVGLPPQLWVFHPATVIFRSIN